MSIESDIQSLQDADRILYQAMRNGGDRAILYSAHAEIADRWQTMRAGTTPTTAR